MGSFVKRWTGTVVLAGLTLLLAVSLAHGQGAETVTVEPTVSAVPEPTRPSITVTDFEFGTVAAQIAGDKRTRKQLEKMGVRDTHGFAEQLGVGAADLIVEKLVAAGGFRVLERKQLEAIQKERGLEPDSVRVGSQIRVVRARYMVSGSVTRLGFEERHLGGALGRLSSPFLYGLGAKKELTEVFLTARVIDTETGEIVASFTGEGASDKGWGVTFFGMGGWGFGNGSAGSRNVRETAIGEATERAAQNISELIGRWRGAMSGVVAAR
jgi:curli biogenesis system outer membrane secretion channel CsgG